MKFDPATFLSAFQACQWKLYLKAVYHLFKAPQKILMPCTSAHCNLSDKTLHEVKHCSMKPSWGVTVRIIAALKLLIINRASGRWCIVTCACTCASLSASCFSLSSHSFSLLLFSSAWAACCLCRDANSCRCFSRLRCFSCSISELGREDGRDNDVQEEERSLRACRWSSMKLSCWTTTAWVRQSHRD